MDDYRGRSVLVIGLARQGKALSRYLVEHGADVVISDRKSAEELVEAKMELADLNVEYALGGHPLTLLDRVDTVCLSGGVPADLPIAETARARGLLITNDSQIFLDGCPAMTVGITGSAGKSTTTAWLGAMADHDAGRTAWIGGNLGRPLLSDLDKMSPRDLAILELSSFQLELMSRSPDVASILNITPNHLDRHKTMAAYVEAKARILDFQGPDAVAVLGREDEGAWNLRYRVRGRQVTFGMAEPLEGAGTYVDQDKIMWVDDGRPQPIAEVASLRLRGKHNLLNALAACALALSAGVPKKAIKEGLATFAGLPHRLELVRRVRGADWYDDSIATAPERVLAALAVFDEPLILLAGGRDKDLPWDAFARVVKRRVKYLILFGEASGKIESAIQAAPDLSEDFRYELIPGLDEAVQRAAELSQPGDVVLLSPGGTSFDAFKDFEARGAYFRELVLAL